MADKSGTDFLQLLVSHICHELVSPTGAIGNGVELLEELGTLDQDALDLIAQSSRTAAAKLRLLRVVYGSAGLSSDFRFPEVHKTLADLFTIDGKVTLDWKASTAAELAAGGTQLLTGLVLLAATCLPRGGTIAIASQPVASGVTAALKATGTGARLPEEIRLAIGGIGTPDHKTVHAHFCAWAANRLGTSVTARAVPPDAVEFSALLPFRAEG